MRHQGGIDCQIGGLSQAQQEAVGLGLGDKVQADVAPGARPVLHDHGPARLPRDLGRDCPRHRIRSAARRVGNDQADRPSVGIAARGQGAQRHGGSAERGSQESASIEGDHDGLSPCVMSLALKAAISSSR
ncbi:hypothetical protein D3C85_1492540 [compost metagenome]